MNLAASFQLSRPFNNYRLSEYCFGILGKMSELSNNTDNILSNFPSCLRKQIEELCLRSKIGFFPIHLEDISIRCIKNSFETDIHNYHFFLKVPYAGKRLQWEVIFDPEDFSFPPDFDFNDEDFLSFPDVDILSQKLPSLNEWNLDNPKALSQILNECLDVYKSHQVEKLLQENIYSRYSEEFKELLDGENGLELNDVQVSVERASIVLLISLKVDCSLLPEYVISFMHKDETLYNQGKDFCHLKILIPKLDGTKTSCLMQLSPRLEQILGKFRNADFKQDKSLSEVVSHVSRTLFNKLQQTANHYSMKKIYIITLAETVCVKNILEYDVRTFNKAVFHYSLDDYMCLVTITMGPKFPAEKPKIKISSIYCPNSKICNEILTDYPYNPEWKPEANIIQMLNYLEAKIAIWKNHSH